MIAMSTPEKLTLLIVDDEIGPRESLRLTLNDRYNCLVAKNGTEGLALARAHHVDLAILDIRMPDINGIEVLRQLKERDPDMECVMLTAYETIDTTRAAIRLGAADYLSKPFDIHEVRALIERYAHRRRAKQAAATQLHTLQLMNGELARDLAETSRAVAASVLSAGVVHELNNPLAIIAGYTDLLSRDLAALDRGELDSAQSIEQRLAKIRKELDRCKDIARRFLAFAKPAVQNAEPTEVNRLLDDAAALVKAHPANAGCLIAVQNIDPRLKVTVYPAEFLQVLLNLGINALQSMNGAGALTFAATAAEIAPPTHRFHASDFDPDQAFIKITVTDTGAGIPPENLRRIFEPYFTTKEEGTGLGLAIVCKLIDHNHGLIDVQSTVGQGTTFSVYLPRAD